MNAATGIAKINEALALAAQPQQFRVVTADARPA